MVLLTEEQKASLRSRIENLISKSDLESITVKGIRKQIEEEDSKDYSSEKAFFNETITACLKDKLEKSNTQESKTKNSANEEEDFLMAMKLQKEEEVKSVQRPALRRRAAGTNRKYQENLIITSSKNKSASSDSTEEKPKRRVLNKPCILSPEMAAVFDNEFSELPRPEVVKKLWEYIKRNDLQDKTDKRFILCDKKLLAVFNKPRINCFKMAKYMSAHVMKKEDLSTSRDTVISAVSLKPKIYSSTSSAASKKTNSPKRSKISNETVEDSDEEAGGFLKSKNSSLNPLLLSVPGVKNDMPYSAVQAAVLAYTQVKKLRDPDNPDMIRIKDNTIMLKLMSTYSEDDVHIIDLIQRVQFLFENENEK